MQAYRDLDGDSGVSAYEAGNDFIIVQFKTGAKYLYNYAATGSGNIEQMKKLAASGNGLNSFIMKNVKKSYAEKLN